ncbi:hypothetical protein DK37_03145, partial [Halomonas sp. SUBG004]
MKNEQQLATHEWTHQVLRRLDNDNAWPRYPQTRAPNHKGRKEVQVTTLQRKTHPRTLSRFATALITAAVMGASAQAVAQDDDPIKVGILHSLSGTMAISESTLKDTVEMLIEQQNEAGGLLGRQLEAVVVDPASNWPLFAE